jgi:molybdate-binding protein
LSEEAGLEFLSVREEEYAFCIPAELESDPRLQALIEVVRSPSYRGMLKDLPGYNSTETGELERIP